MPADGDGDLMAGSVRKLGHYVGTVSTMYGLKPEARLWLHREQEPLVIVRKAGEKEPQKEEILAPSKHDINDLLAAVVEAVSGGAK